MSQATDRLTVEEKTLTAHEALTSLVWLVAGAYTAYIVWFIVRSIKDH